MADFSCESKSNDQNHQVVFLDKNSTGQIRHWRRHIPDKSSTPIRIWPILSRFIKMDLTRIAMPINLNEPISLLQRITEQLEYSFLLDEAAKYPNDPVMEMVYVCAFIVSGYSHTRDRFSKPFNPLLGETYEFEASADLGWRTIAEQVSHHPPTMAQHTESPNWIFYHEMTVSGKFRGKYLKMTPIGDSVLRFRESGNSYSWSRLAVTVNNIIVGKLWIDNHGEMTVINHKTGHTGHIKFHGSTYFALKINRHVTVEITNSRGNICMKLSGEWDSYMDLVRPDGETVKLWNVVPYPPENEKKYMFSDFTMNLNAPEPGVAPTDSRHRPDQRLMEEGDIDLAAKFKLKLEEKQRRNAPLARRPLWFRIVKDEITGNLMYRYGGEYWPAKKKQDWSSCPDIFNIS